MRLLHANVRSYNSNGEELMAMARDLGASVVSLNETWLRPDSQLNTPGFQVFRNDRVGQIGGGVAILVGFDVPASAVDLGAVDCGSAEVVACLLHLSQPLLVVSVYCAHGYVPGSGLLTYLSAQPNVLIMGDFNAKHPALWSHGTNIAGSALVADLSTLDLSLISRGDPTHTSPSGASDQLDIVLASPVTASRVHDIYIGEDFGSDHLPVIIDLSRGAATGTVDNNCDLWFDLKLADWDQYQSNLQERLDQHLLMEATTPAQVDLLQEHIVSSVMSAASQAVPKRPRGKLKTWKASAELLRVIRLRRRFRRLWMDTRRETFKTLYNAMTKERNRLIAEAKREAWQAYCERLQHQFHVSSRDFWQSFKSQAAGNRGETRRVPPLRKDDGTFEATDAGKAAMFADRLVNAFKIPEGPAMDEDWKQHVETFVSNNDQLFHPLNGAPEGEEQNAVSAAFCNITEEELQRTINQLKHKAPGEDDMLNAFLKNGGPVLTKWLVCLYRSSLRLGYYPQAWKLAKMSMVRKPGKDPHDRKGYRPLSLLAAVARLLEKVRARWFREFMEDKGMLPLHQSSCRSARCTSDHLFWLVHDVSVGFDRNQCTAAAFLDVEGAFDSVWHDGLRYKLAHSGLPAVAVRWLSDMLRGRKFFVQVGKERSAQCVIESGVPQGSPLSPQMFIFYIADLPTDQLQRTKTSTYADDIAGWSSSRSPVVAAARIQHWLMSISTWCGKWRLRLAPAKCKVICFSKGPTQPLNIWLNGTLLQEESIVRFLGITFDKRLNWRQHIQQLRDTGMRRLNALKALGGQNRGLSPSILISVYIAYVRSVLEYGCVAWLRVSGSWLAKLQVVQNNALRLALRRPVMGTRIVDLHEEAGIPTLAQLYLDRSVDFANKSMAFNPLVGQLIGTYRGLRQLNPSTPLAFFEERLPHGPWHRPDLIRQRASAQVDRF